MSAVTWFFESTMGNDMFWNIAAIMLICIGIVYAERSIEFAGFLDAFVAMTSFVAGWFIFLSYDYSVARPIGIIIPFINISLYIYIAWLLGQDTNRISRLGMLTISFFSMYAAAWVGYAFFKSRSQPMHLAALNVTGASLILLGTAMLYTSVPRTYTMLTIMGGQPATLRIYHGTTGFTPVFVVLTTGWAFLATNQVIQNYLV